MNLDEGRHVLVIGSAGIDIKGRPAQDVIKGASIAGLIRSSVGGVARNIAENLARLEVPTVLLSAVGDDPDGEHVLRHSQEAGIDVSQVKIVPHKRTGRYMAILTTDGQLDLAINDFEIGSEIDAPYLAQQESLFANAAMIVLDANPDQDALRTVFKFARRYKTPVCADPTTPSLARRLRPYLNRIMMMTPNLQEAAALSEYPIDRTDVETALSVAQTLLEQGVRIAVVTLGMRGLAYASGFDRGLIPAIRTEIRDETGAGDALTAGVIFGLLHDVPLDEALRLGVSAASLTLRSPDTVARDLSQEMLYDQLVL